MTEPLKNCPFCGRAPTSIVRSDDIDGTQFLCTITCYCGRYYACAHKMAIRKTPEIAKADAIAAWNTRTPQPAQAQAGAVPPELSPDFTDTARAALLWVLWHHQGGSSPVGQPIRFALGMGQHDRLNEHQLAEAKRWERLHPVNPSVFPRGPEPLTNEQISE